jgi:NAD(P)-dependent dehydrogenase (short-subunit alcohol dehydrogenase family)
MKHIVITGANRGIGLGLTKEFLKLGWLVTAIVRKQSAELKEVALEFKDKFNLVLGDVSDDQSITRAAQSLDGKSVDLLVNNAGVLHDSDLHGINSASTEDLLTSFNINAIGPLRVTKALLPNLQKASTPIVANITSKMGSIQDNTSGGYYGYRMSKTALNMFHRSFSHDFPNFITLTLHPGWVQTDMGGSQAPLSISESVKGLTNILSTASPKVRGKFLNYDGSELPW